MNQHDPITWRDFLFMGGVVVIIIGAAVANTRPEIGVLLAILGVLTMVILTVQQIRKTSRKRW